MKLQTLFCVIAAAGLLVACGEKKEENAELPKYDIMKLKLESRTVTYNYPAVLSSDKDVSLFPQVTGRIIATHYQKGSLVKKGQALVDIDPTPYRLKVESDAANVKAAEAALSSAKLQYESQQKLFEKKIVSEFVMKTAQNSYLAAQAQLAQAKAALNNSRTDLAHCTVVAPISGIVNPMMDNLGLLVSPSMPQALLTISDQTNIVAKFSLTEDFFNQLSRDYSLEATDDGIRSKSGSSLRDLYPEIQLRSKDGTLYEEKGQFSAIGGIIDASTGSVICEVKFPNPNFNLIAGSSATVVFPSSIKDALVVPQTACKKLQDKYLVYKIDKNGQTVGVLVNVVPTNDGKEYIISDDDLKPGDEIIASGVSRIQEGQRVK